MLKPGTTVSVAEKEQQETKEDQPQDEILKTDLINPPFEQRHGMADAVPAATVFFS